MLLVPGPEGHHTTGSKALDVRQYIGGQKATNQVTHYGMWVPIDEFLRNTLLWAVCREALRKTKDLLGEEMQVPLKSGAFLNSPFAVDVVGQAMLLGERDPELRHDEIWRGLVPNHGSRVMEEVIQPDASPEPTLSGPRSSGAGSGVGEEAIVIDEY